MIEKTFVGLDTPTAVRHGAGGRPAQGVYYRRTGTTPKIAMIATHYAIDFSEHYLAEYMAERGIGFLGWNTRFRGNEQVFLLDHALVDIGAGVRWLREQAGVDHVVLLGNSGGGSLMAAYQSQAVDPNVTPLPGMRAARGLDDLIAGDAYVSTAAHLGRPEVLTNWFDPSVVDESDPTSVDESLSLFHQGRTAPFDADFIARYRAAQVERNHRITAWVKEELERVTAAGFSDRLFNLHRAWADPRMVDPSIEPTNREPNSCYAGVPERANRSVFGIAGTNSLRTWLSLWSLEDSQTRATPHLNRITRPALVVNADADTGVFPSDQQANVDALGSDDITTRVLSADHYFRRPADTGFDDTGFDDSARIELADLVAEWISARVG